MTDILTPIRRAESRVRLLRFAVDALAARDDECYDRHPDMFGIHSTARWDQVAESLSERGIHVTAYGLLCYKRDRRVAAGLADGSLEPEDVADGIVAQYRGAERDRLIDQHETQAAAYERRACSIV